MESSQDLQFEIYETGVVLPPFRYCDVSRDVSSLRQLHAYIPDAKALNAKILDLDPFKGKLIAGPQPWDTREIESDSDVLYAGKNRKWVTVLLEGNNNPVQASVPSKITVSPTGIRFSRWIDETERLLAFQRQWGDDWPSSLASPGWLAAVGNMFGRQHTYAEYLKRLVVEAAAEEDLAPLELLQKLQDRVARVKEASAMEHAPINAEVMSLSQLTKKYPHDVVMKWRISVRSWTHKYLDHILSGQPPSGMDDSSESRFYSLPEKIQKFFLGLRPPSSEEFRYIIVVAQKLSDGSYFDWIVNVSKPGYLRKLLSDVEDDDLEAVKDWHLALVLMDVLRDATRENDHLPKYDAPRARDYFSGKLDRNVLDVLDDSPTVRDYFLYQLEEEAASMNMNLHQLWNHCRKVLYENQTGRTKLTGKLFDDKTVYYLTNGDDADAADTVPIVPYNNPRINHASTSDVNLNPGQYLVADGMVPTDLYSLEQIAKANAEAQQLKEELASTQNQVKELMAQLEELGRAIDANAAVQAEKEKEGIDDVIDGLQRAYERFKKSPESAQKLRKACEAANQTLELCELFQKAASATVETPSQRVFQNAIEIGVSLCRLIMYASGAFLLAFAAVKVYRNYDRVAEERRRNR
jgi:hypothetical protein